LTLRSDLRSNFTVPSPLLKKTTIYPQKHRSGNVTWIVHVGKKINGKADLHRFKHKADAEAFHNEWNLKSARNATPDLADLQGVARHEILAAVGKLKLVHATLTEAVDFFLRFGRPPRGKISVEQAVQAFLETKQRKKRSEKYQTTMRSTTLRPFARAVGAELPIAAVTREKVEKFLHGNRNWSSRSIKTHHGYLATFFRWCLKERYVLLNPVEGFELPKISKTNVTYWEPHELWIQLETALEGEQWGELGAIVLASFCGLRVEETPRLAWDRINLEKRQLTMDGEHVKTTQRRFAEIPAVAVQWLKQIPAEWRTSGNVTTRSDLKNGLRRLRRALELNGWLTRRVQNGYRQAFAACHYALHHNAQFLSELMANSPAMVRSQYHELATKENAEVFFNLFPKQTLVEGLIAALTSNVFSRKAEIDAALTVAKAPLLLYHDSNQTAALFDGEEMKTLELTQESLKHAATNEREGIDFEVWPEVQEKPLPPTVAKALYQVYAVRERYGFSPLEPEAILLLKRVRDHLESAFEVEFKSWSPVVGGKIVSKRNGESTAQPALQ
jgi:integrase